MVRKGSCLLDMILGRVQKKVLARDDLPAGQPCCLQWDSETLFLCNTSETTEVSRLTSRSCSTVRMPVTDKETVCYLSSRDLKEEGIGKVNSG